MHLLIAVLNNEEILEDLITGWLDIGVTGGTVMDTTDLLQLISTHIPIFAGFRALVSGGSTHNKTLFTAIEEEAVLHQAVAFLESLCLKTSRPHQGVYFVVPLTGMGRLGVEVDREQHQRHVEKKLGRPVGERSGKSLEEKKE